MKSHSAKTHRTRLALFVLLALQLVIGLQLQAAQPVEAAVHSSAAHGSRAGGPTSLVAARSTHAAVGAVATESAASHAGCPTHPVDGGKSNHDCCHAGACECHCANPPAVIDLPAPANIATSAAIPSFASAQFVAPRIDEFLRPPIA